MMLPSSPNWYCTKAIDVRYNLVAYSARGDVNLFTLADGQLTHLQTASKLHKDRITAVR